MRSSELVLTIRKKRSEVAALYARHVEDRVIKARQPAGIKEGDEARDAGRKHARLEGHEQEHLPAKERPAT